MKKILSLSLWLLCSISFVSCNQKINTCLENQEYLDDICVDITEYTEPEVNTDNLFNINTGNSEGWLIFTNFKDEPTIDIQNNTFTFHQVYLDGTFDSLSTWARKISYDLTGIIGEANYTLQFNAIGTALETFTIYVQLGSNSVPVEADFTLDGTLQRFSMDINHPYEVNGTGLIKIGFGTFSDGSNLVLSDIQIIQNELEDPDLNILFIGNSHTFYNSMPEMFENMGLYSGQNIHVEELTESGYMLHYFLDPQYYKSQVLQEYLNNVDWDYIILQEHSLIPPLYKQVFLESVRQLNQVFNLDTTEVILFQTWGYRDGSDRLAETGLEYDEMHLLLKDAYEEASELYDTLLAPVGTVFYNLTIDETGIDVLNIDDYHPSLLGSYVAALTFYAMIFGIEYNESYLPEGISELDASLIMTYVYETLDIDIN